MSINRQGYLHLLNKQDYKFKYPSETHIQLQALKYLRDIKHYPCGKIKVKGYQNKQGNYIFDKYNFVGIADLLCFIPQIVFIECKTIKGKLSPEQIDFRNLCHKAGIKYFVITDISQLKDL